MQTPPRILYLSMVPDNPSQMRKLAGIRRYAAAVGWEVVCVAPAEATPGKLPALLRRHDPIGCVADGVGCQIHLPPGLFGPRPVVFIGYPRRLAGGHPNFMFDADALARSAFRELAAGKPAVYAAVGFPRPRSWSVRRVAAFRRIVRDAGAECVAFRPVPLAEFETDDAFAERLAAWLARLPVPCAVFAVSDETAVLVSRAAQVARRNIPRELTLCSIDNFEDLCESAPTPVTSIELDFEHLGFMAAKALGERIGATAKTLSSSLAPVGPLLTVRRESTRGRGRREARIADAVEMIRREACDGLTAANLAARFRGSRNLFERRFREATGHSVLDEILHVRLEKAFTLLARTDTPIGAVAALCGFRTDIALHKLFRSRTGLSMSAWRRRSRG